MDGDEFYFNIDPAQVPKLTHDRCIQIMKEWKVYNTKLTVQAVLDNPAVPADVKARVKAGGSRMLKARMLIEVAKAVMDRF